MLYPEARVSAVAHLGPVAAEELLTKAQHGDLQALADWTVRAWVKKLIREGTAPVAAIQRAREIVRACPLEVRFKPADG